jgi:hypothetical protein
MSLLFASLLLLVQSPHTDSKSSSLKFDEPKGWTSKPPASRMRLAEFTLPRAEGDAEDAALAIFYFGGGGGSVEANLDRWISQMSQPDGRASKAVAKSSKLDANGLAITLVDVPGTYVAETSPGSNERLNKPGFRLRAAVVEGKGGPYFVKLTGPAKTVAKWDASFLAFLKGLRVE